MPFLFFCVSFFVFGYTEAEATINSGSWTVIGNADKMEVCSTEPFILEGMVYNGEVVRSVYSALSANQPGAYNKDLLSGKITGCDYFRTVDLPTCTNPTSCSDSTHSEDYPVRWIATKPSSAEWVPVHVEVKSSKKRAVGLKHNTMGMSYPVARPATPPN